jgi:hypothetical protein
MTGTDACGYRTKRQCGSAARWTCTPSLRLLNQEPADDPVKLEGALRNHTDVHTVKKLSRKFLID